VWHTAEKKLVRTLQATVQAIAVEYPGGPRPRGAARSGSTAPRMTMANPVLDVLQEARLAPPRPLPQVAAASRPPSYDSGGPSIQPVLGTRAGSLFNQVADSSASPSDPVTAHILAQSRHAAREAFLRFNIAHNGAISRNEAIQVIRHLGLDSLLTDGYMVGVWNVYDTDGSSYLSQDEFAQFYAVMLRKSGRADGVASSRLQRVTPPNGPSVVPSSNPLANGLQYRRSGAVGYRGPTVTESKEI
jgi:hypothetical protein